MAYQTRQFAMEQIAFERGINIARYWDIYNHTTLMLSEFPELWGFSPDVKLALAERFIWYIICQCTQSS